MHHDAIEKVVIWLHGPPCPNTNPTVSSMSMPEIVDTFWNEFNAFKTAPILIMCPAVGQVPTSQKGILTYGMRSIPFHTRQC